MDLYVAAILLCALWERPPSRGIKDLYLLTRLIGSFLPRAGYREIARLPAYLFGTRALPIMPGRGHDSAPQRGSSCQDHGHRR